MSPTIDEVIAALETSFGGETRRVGEDFVAERFRGSDDATEMLEAMAEGSWLELRSESLFFHREMLGRLSAVGYRALIAAFLRASLLDEERGGDLVDYSLMSLQPLSDDEEDVATATARLAELTGEQREAIRLYLSHVASAFGNQEAAEILALWEKAAGPEEGPAR